MVKKKNNNRDNEKCDDICFKNEIKYLNNYIKNNYIKNKCIKNNECLLECCEHCEDKHHKDNKDKDAKKKKIGNINVGILINKICENKRVCNEYNYSNDSIRYIIEDIKTEQKVIQKFLEEYNKLISINMKINGSFIIGLGGQSSKEFDITLHHTYGIPYIPGSSIKGVFRNYIIEEYFSQNEDWALKDCAFIDMFGGTDKNNQTNQGKIIFMDSFPNNCNLKLEKEIMAPHPQQYNSEDNSNDLPLDSDEVQVLPYLVVKEQAYEEKSNQDIELVFKLNIFVNKSINNKLNYYKKNSFIKDICKENNKFLSIAIEREITKMLQCKGVGGKTSVGYGYFDAIKDKEQNQIEELVAVDKY